MLAEKPWPPFIAGEAAGKPTTPFSVPRKGPEQSDLQRPPVVYPELPDTLAENFSSIPTKCILGAFPCSLTEVGGLGSPCCCCRDTLL